MEYKGKPYPPIYFFVSLVVMIALHYLVPIHQLFSTPFKYAGVPFVVGGVCITAVAAGTFVKVGTPVVPFEKSTVIVIYGLFRFSRNPMYLGMVIALVGVALLLGSATAFMPIPIFVWLIHNQFICREEKFLEELFGEEYLAYKIKVRRWL